MEHLPFYIYITFGATVIFGLWLFFKATNYSKYFLMVLVTWLIIQSVLSVAGFYNNPANMTARFPLLVLPALVAILSLFINKKGRAFIDHLDLPTLTIFHVVRLPVEIVLFWLFVNSGIPEAMTFHGSNFDIFSGISAPFIYYFGFIKKAISKSVIIGWNLICLTLLLKVVATALLSLPAHYQDFGFKVPDTALGYFPFVLLPACLVPLVLLSHLAALRQLLKKD
jgi:hypothetical protein